MSSPSARTAPNLQHDLHIARIAAALLLPRSHRRPPEAALKVAPAGVPRRAPARHRPAAHLLRADTALAGRKAPLVRLDTARPYRPRDGDDDGEHDGGGRPIGVKINAVYESASYTALLIGDGQASAADGFARLALLPSRLLGPLRQQLLDHLAANFDTLPLPLELPQTLLRHGLDGFMADSCGGGGKDVELTLAGKGEGLRRITITVAAEDARQFCGAGSARAARGF